MRVRGRLLGSAALVGALLVMVEEGGACGGRVWVIKADRAYLEN
jgi:hypothetical protein